MRRWHWMAIDAAVALPTAFLAVAKGDGDVGPGQFLFPSIVAASILVAMTLRRRAPVTMFGGLLIMAALVSDMRPRFHVLLLLAAAYVLYTVTVTASKRSGAAGLALVLAVMAVILSTSRVESPGALFGDLIPVALANLIACTIGYSVRQRRLYVLALQQQAASSAVTQERLRIARELHDVVAHSMSVIAVQAGYGQYVIDMSPEGAKEALGTIQATSRDALDEMRRMLGVLRQQDAAAVGRDGAAKRPDPAQLAPAPGLADLDRLIQRTCSAGVLVRVSVTGDTRPVPAIVDLSAFRIIQEALTNVVKHAGTGAHCTVSLVYAADALDIQVTDNGGRSLVPSLPNMNQLDPLTVGAGHGVIGMRERAHLCGGGFSASPLAEGGFRVTATLPLPPADAADNDDSGWAEQASGSELADSTGAEG
jgi:signal transduction histidine kinase